MRIGVDATCWHNTRGYGRHARALLGALLRGDGWNHYVFITDSSAELDTLTAKVEVRRVAAAAPTIEAASANGRRGLADMWRMSRALAAPDLDILLFPTVYSYVPVFSRAKKVVMIHDIIAETYPKLTVPRPLARCLWKAKVAFGRWQAHALVTVSEHSRRGLVEYFRLQPERVYVVGEASDPVFRVLDDPRPTPRLANLGLVEGRMLVYVGGFSPHKNLETLLTAFARIATQDDLADVRLVLVGEYEKEVFHSYYGTIRRQVEDLGLSPRVVFTGFLPDKELVTLLNRATALALPSLLEGFGLPAVEAAACGCPVVATTASPLPELLRDGGLFIDPLDRPGWERALLSVLRSRDLRQRLRREGLAAAQRLTWDTAARQLLTVLHSVAS
jgi:glycosyltransferase involved in cell wall biosynthesis